MLDGRLKLKKKNNRVYGSIILPSPSGSILATSKEVVVGGDVDEAVAKVTDQILKVAEFFPLRDLIGEESFTKAASLYATLKKGSKSQQATALREMKQIVNNSRTRKDPTAQDIDYALARFARAEKIDKIVLSGNFAIDVFGFSPEKLKENLNKLAEKNPFFAKARELYYDLKSGDEKRISRAARYIKKLYLSLNDNVSGEHAPAHAVLLGLSQYKRADDVMSIKKKLYGNEHVVVGFSLKKAFKKVKKVAKALNRPLTMPIATAKKGGIKNFAKAAMQAAVLPALGPAAVPILATKKGRAVFNLTRSAKAGKPAERKMVASIITRASAGDATATRAVRTLRLASRVDSKINLIKRDARAGKPQAKAFAIALKNADVAPEYLPEDMKDFEESETYYDEYPGDEQYEEVYDNTHDEYVEGDGLIIIPEEVVGFKLKMPKLPKGIKKAITPGKKFKQIATFAKPIAKALVPLAAKAADAYAPGSGIAVQAALPALIDAVPSNKPIEMPAMMAAIDTVKAATEMDPEALQKIDTIKNLASQGVPKAQDALAALKVAKSIQKVTESTASAILADRQAGKEEKAYPGVHTAFGHPSGTSPVKKKTVLTSNGDGIVDVRVVEWGPK